jgi:UPF0755 protein
MKFLRPAAVLAVLVLAFASYRVMQPYKGFAEPVFVDIPRGAGSATIARQLSEAGVVRSRWEFLLARMAQRGRRLQAGEYRFSAAASPFQVVGRLARGDIFFYDLVVPEGKTMFDIGAAAEHLGIFPEAEFVAEARKPEMIRDLDPQAPSLEGYLFPSTYRLNRHSTPERLCRMMTTRFRQEWAKTGSRAPLHETITLASLVERESKLSEERPEVAAVFLNRLKIGMKLDCDSTTIYAALLEGVYRGAIYRSDLDRVHPYNTYRSAGLPPGPIGNPGVESIMAALHPSSSDALYFVLRPDGSGAHVFNSNLAAHTAAVQRYRRADKQNSH